MTPLPPAALLDPRGALGLAGELGAGQELLPAPCTRLVGGTLPKVHTALHCRQPVVHTLAGPSQPLPCPLHPASWG